MAPPQSGTARAVDGAALGRWLRAARLPGVLAGLDVQRSARLAALVLAGAVLTALQLRLALDRTSGHDVEPAPSQARTRSAAVVAAVLAPPPAADAADAAAGSGDLAAPVVVVHAVGADGQVLCTGSGAVVAADGLVVIPAHVVRDVTPCDYERLTVGVIEAPGQPPAPRYGAAVVAYDTRLDLAVLHLSTAADGTPLAQPPALAAVPLGDSDLVPLGEQIRVVGSDADVAGAGTGSVVGFAAEEGVAERAWITTDATVAGPAAMAIDSQGRLIGLPAQPSTGGPPGSACPVAPAADGGAPAVPCGSGGGLRPVNVARPLFDHAQLRQPVDPAVLQAP